MIQYGAAMLWYLTLIAPGPAVENPKTSADVVKMTFERYSIADGLETYFVTLKIARGWQVYANPDGRWGAKIMPVVAAHLNRDRATNVTVQIDGKKGWIYDVAHSGRIGLRKDAEGKIYGAYEGTVSFTVWLAWDDTSVASDIVAHVRVIATNGKTRLKESIVTAKAK